MLSAGKTVNVAVQSPFFIIPAKSALAIDLFSARRIQYGMAAAALIRAGGAAFGDEVLSTGFIGKANNGLAADELIAITGNGRPQMAPSVFVFGGGRAAPTGGLKSSGGNDGESIKAEGGGGATFSGADDIVVSKLVEKMDVSTALWVVEQEKTNPAWRVKQHLDVGMHVRNTMRKLGLPKRYDDSDIDLDNVWADVLLQAAQRRLAATDVDPQNLPEPKFNNLLTMADLLASHGATEADYARGVRFVKDRFDFNTLRNLWEEFKETGDILSIPDSLFAFLEEKGFTTDFAHELGGKIVLDAVKQIWGE